MCDAKNEELKKSRTTKMYAVSQLTSRTRDIGLLAVGFPMDAGGTQCARFQSQCWNKPVGPNDVVMEVVGVGVPLIKHWYVFAQGRSVVVVDRLIVSGHRFRNVLIRWSPSRKDVSPLDWLQAHCHEPIRLFGDGPMLDNEQLEFGFLADVC